MDKDLTPWYMPEWLSLSTLRSFTWENEVYLYFILAIPLLFALRWLWRYRFNQKLPVAVSQKDLHVSPINLIRLIPEFLIMLVLAFTCMALARPQKTNEKVEQWTEGIDIMIALDISQSMQIEDFLPNYGIKIYTIVVGKEGLVPYGKDFFGRPNMIENTVDETTMRRIAEIGGGEFFRATDNQALAQVFARIDQFEKAEIKETRFKDTSDYYFIYLQWGVVFFLLWLLLKSTFVSNVLQD
jgi:hypothetical protein